MVYQATMQREKLRKGPWHEEEDELLTTFVTVLGERRWDYIARASGLKRSGKSCRFRWLNYLRPNIKHGHISTEEEQTIIQLHKQWGNKWSRIAQRLPGRTDNEIKNYWRTHLRRKMHSQEQETCHCGRDYAREDFLFQKVDFEVQKYEAANDHKPVEDDTFVAGGNTSFDNLAIPNFPFTSSPYENRLKDWMTTVSNDSCKINHQEDCNSRSMELYDDLWWWSGSLWDMN